MRRMNKKDVKRIKKKNEEKGEDWIRVRKKWKEWKRLKITEENK